MASYKPFKDQNFSLSNLYEALSAIDAEIIKVLDTLSLHKIGMAKSLFRGTLMAEFPEKPMRLIGKRTARTELTG